LNGRSLLILGASARAAALSAVQAGFRVTAGDLFADADLRLVCPAVRCASYTRGFAEIAAQSPPGEWMYTGALENYPDLIDSIAASRPLLGNKGPVVRAVRDPRRVHSALTRAGLRCPECCDTATGAPPLTKGGQGGLLLPRDGNFLRKKRRSAGGTHVEIWNDANPAPPDDPKWFFQRRIAGIPCAAVYLGVASPPSSPPYDGGASGGRQPPGVSLGRDIRRALLLGATEQLIGAPWCGGAGFQYCGSIGPLEVPHHTREQIERIGQALAAEFSLAGLFGVDFILDERGDVWPVEVNPRFTASVEIIERATGISAVGLHVSACRGPTLTRSASEGEEAAGSARRLPHNEGGSWHGKAILFARQPTTIRPDIAKALLAASLSPRCEAADVPDAGAKIAAGAPVCTVFALGAGRQEVLNQLRHRTATWQKRLENPADLP
jgi:predicted ATP-grasp superfamily ATP-dependent carboligase